MPPSDDASTSAPRNTTWIPRAASPSDNPHMGDDFARAYDGAASRITGPLSLAALDLVGGVGAETRILDIAAGAGALSVPAAERGASVVAIDIAPGMVRRLSAKLAPFSRCEVRLMDGQTLELEDASFDAAFSIIGVSLFPDWRKGLREQARVLRPGGKGCVATWRKPPGGGPFLVMAQALRTVFPDRPPPAAPEGFVVLSEPARLGDGLREAGFTDVSVVEVETVWEGPGGDVYLEELKDLHPYMGPYRMLTSDERRKIDEAILTIVEAATLNGRVSLGSPALLAVGTRR
jgi:ubiquinone/menaquinone biosynthesis C-methylase UbiE